MKKVYSKPTIHFETLSLVQHIANCGLGSRGGDNPFGHATSTAASLCGFKMEQLGLTVFSQGMSQCTDVQVEEGTDFEGICYNTVAAGYTIFSS